MSHPSANQESGPGSGPVVLPILGISARCGSNFFFKLLLSHPSIAPASGLVEDRLLCNAHGLFAFVDDLRSEWGAKWDRGADAAELEHDLVGTVERFVLRDDTRLRQPRRTPGYVLIRTPNTRNLDLFPRLFPRSPLLILIRDGRDVCESARRSWGRSINDMAERWNASAERIETFVSSAAELGVRVKVVRYEDLVAELQATVSDVYRFLLLDPSETNWAQARDTPLLGSSSVGRKEGSVSWEPLARPSTFDPIGRYREWPEQWRESYNLIAGAATARMGYDTT